MPTKILVIDDDPFFLQLMEVYVNNLSDIKLLCAVDGVDGLAKFERERPDLIITDIMMPQLDGFELTQRIRQHSTVPIIMLTARDQEEDIIKGLNMGANDYLTKPCRLAELLARVRANLRRVHLEQAPARSLTYGDDYLTVDLATGRVTVRGEEIKLSSKEFDILHCLLTHSGRWVTSEELMQRVWPAGNGSVASLATIIYNLSHKLEADPNHPVYLRRGSGWGYRFDSQA
jgi:two-component system KDP operon response regulator KdpE